MRERAITAVGIVRHVSRYLVCVCVRDGVRERHVDLDGLRDQVLDLTEHGEVVLGLDVFGVRCV